MQSSQSAPSGRRAKRALVAALAVLAFGCLAAPAAVGQEPPDFTVNPSSPLVGQQAEFTPNPTLVPDGASVEWRYGASGPFAPEGIHTFDVAGAYVVTMRVTETMGPHTDYSQTVSVRPVAAFHRDPPESVVLAPGQAATFFSDSSAGSTLGWIIDGVDAGGEQSVQQSFVNPGQHSVRLEVTQNGQSNVAISQFRVNAPPVAGFVWTPGSPVAGSEVQLYSTSVDAEGPLEQAWDLDDDGQFDDASGSPVVQTFTAGDHQVSLQVTDNDGMSRTITRTINVAAPPSTPSPLASPALMKPFPTVRFVGFVVPKGARITLVEVRSAPRVARVTVRCTGEGCPFRSRQRVAETGRVRLSNFKRVLKAGTRIEVFVRAPGVIGKYAAFRIRAGKRPLRADRCLMPGASKPTPCT